MHHRGLGNPYTAYYDYWIGGLRDLRRQWDQVKDESVDCIFLSRVARSLWVSIFMELESVFGSKEKKKEKPNKYLRELTGANEFSDLFVEIMCPGESEGVQMKDFESFIIAAEPRIDLSQESFLKILRERGVKFGKTEKVDRLIEMFGKLFEKWEHVKKNSRNKDPFAWVMDYPNISIDDVLEAQNEATKEMYKGKTYEQVAETFEKIVKEKHGISVDIHGNSVPGNEL